MELRAGFSLFFLWKRYGLAASRGGAKQAVIGTRIRTSGIIATTLFVIAIAICGVAGARLLIWVAPWRETEVLIAASAAFVGGLALWFWGRPIAGVRCGLAAVSAMILAGGAYFHYQVFLSHYEKEFPSVARHLGPSSFGSGSSAPSSQDALYSLAPSSQVPRALLLDQLRNLPHDKEVISEADKILASRFEYYGYPAASLPTDLSWREDPFEDPSWNWRLHNMGYVATLARAYERSGQEKYLRRGEELVLDWISDNTLYIFSPPSIFSWNDHSTAFRLMNLMYFFDVWIASSLFDSDKMETIFRSLLGHASLLADDGFYTFNHNHGIDQDRALLLFFAMHSYVDTAKQWRDLALDRLREQFRFAVSPRGIHLEHSPDYHLYGLHQLERVRKFLVQLEIHDPLLDEIAQTTAMMAAYVPHLVKPNGQLVTVGDTGKTPITEYKALLAPFAPQVPGLDDLIEMGRTRQFGDLALAFPEEGYGVIRDFAGGQLDFCHSFYLFFAAGAHEDRVHRQADDLSFVLVHGGRDILVDPGYYSYKPGAGRPYVIGATAHNTVVVDGASYRGWDTTFDGFQTNDRYTSMRASHRNYPGFEHERWLIHIRPGLVFLVDRLMDSGVPPSGSEDRAAHRFDQLFHFAPDLQVVLGRSGREARVLDRASNQEAVLRVVQLGEAEPVMTVVEGQESPMQGWHSPAHGELVPAPALISRLQGEAAQFITALELPRLVGTPLVRKFEAVTTGDNLSVHWIEGDEPQRLTLDLSSSELSLD